MESYKGKFIVQKQKSKNIRKIKPKISKPHFFVEKKDNNNALSSANKKVNENLNENKEKKLHNEDDNLTIEILDENPNNIKNDVYNFDFNLSDKKL